MSVSEIESALKRTKRGIHHVLARGNDLKQKFRSGRPLVTALSGDRRIRNLASTGNYSLSQMKHAVRRQISKPTVRRRVFESDSIKNRKMARYHV